MDSQNNQSVSNMSMNPGNTTPPETPLATNTPMPFPSAPVSEIPPSVPTPISQAPANPEPPRGGGTTDKHEKMMYVAAGVLFVIALAGVVFLVMSYMQSQTKSDLNENMVLEPTVPMPTEPAATTSAESLSPVPTLSSSNEIEAIEQDVEATDLTELDSGLTTLEEELSQ